MQSTLFYPDQISGVEDCLYLNIYKPITDGSRKLDVVIHIHGGGFVAGYGQEYTNAKYIMDRDIIFVTMQYRLGPLGKTTNIFLLIYRYCEHFLLTDITITYQ